MPTVKDLSTRKYLVPLMAGKILISNQNCPSIANSVRKFIMVPELDKQVNQWEKLAQKLERMSTVEIDTYRLGSSSFAKENNWKNIAKQWILNLN